jgi:hypothetical protein
MERLIARQKSRERERKRTGPQAILLWILTTAIEIDHGGLRTRDHQISPRHMVLLSIAQVRMMPFSMLGVGHL